MAATQIRGRCVVRGSINIDEFFHVPRIVHPGETLSSTHYERRAGGKGANQAVAVARAGGAVSLIGAVGVDGKWVAEGLQEAGVDVRGVVIADQEPTGRAVIQLAHGGENSIILLQGANYITVRDDNDEPFTHCLLQNEIPFQSTLAALARAHALNATSVFNPSPMPTPDQLRQLPWAQLTWLVVNEGEARELLTVFDSLQATTAADSAPLIYEKGQASFVENTSEYPADWPAHPVLQQAGALLRRLHGHPSFSPKVNLVCTLGALGVVARIPGVGPLYVPAAKLDGAVRDTTGAGDCFTGYLVAGLMELAGLDINKIDIELSLRRAVEAAGLCVQRPGAMESIPTRGEVDARLH